MSFRSITDARNELRTSRDILVEALAKLEDLEESIKDTPHVSPRGVVEELREVSDRLQNWGVSWNSFTAVTNIPGHVDKALLRVILGGKEQGQ